MAMKPLRVEATWYVIDADLQVIVEGIAGPADRDYIIKAKAQKNADEYARKTGHSVIVVRPVSYH